MAIEWASPADLAMLALERHGGIPQHLGVVLLLDPQPPRSAEEIRSVLVERIPAVPRLRQCLVRAPLGCGPPIWVDDPDFDPARHVRVQPCPRPGDEPAVLDLAADVMTEPLSPSYPRWAAVVAPGLAGGRLAVVLVLHHVLADGLGGLAILTRLVDGAETEPMPPFPRPAPRRRELAADAFRARLRALIRLQVAWREARRSMAAAGGLRPRRAAPCSLLAPTGRGRRFTTARADLDALRQVGHARGASVNDVLLAALAGAVHALLAERGEQVDELRMAVMVSARGGASADAPGNRVAPLVVTVPAAGTAAERLHRVAGVVGAARASAAAQPPIAALQPLFRLIAAAGLYRRYMNHQRRLHLLVSNVPGPREPVALGGVPVTAAVPLAVGEAGNLTITALALSYTSMLTVTLIVDPDRVPDLDLLTRALQGELDGYTRPSGPGGAVLAEVGPAPAARTGTRALDPRRTNALPPALGRRVNAAVERLAARGLTPANTVSLEVTGRRTGLPRRTAVVVARHAGRDHVVSLAGESEWVRNVRAAGGRAVVRHGGTRTVRLTEVAPADRAPVLKAFLSRRALTRSPARSARIYFGLPAHPAVEQLEPLAEHYPVFEISDEPCPPAVGGATRVQARAPV